MALDIEKCKECYYADEDGVCDKCCVDNAAFTPKRPNERICEWISVKDRLPEKAGTYIVHIRQDKVKYTKNVFAASYSAEQKIWAIGEAVSDSLLLNGITQSHKHIYVSHWMPLPKPPEGE